MDGFNPNAFLAKKLMTEGLIDDEDEIKEKPKEKEAETSKSKETKKAKEIKEKEVTPEKSPEKPLEAKKRASDASIESDTQVVIKQEKVDLSIDVSKEKDVKREKSTEKRKGELQPKVVEEKSTTLDHPPVKKRKASPIVFDVDRKFKEAKEAAKERQRTESASSDSHVIVTTATNSHKYDALPSREYYIIFSTLPTILLSVVFISSC